MQATEHVCVHEFKSLKDFLAVAEKQISAIF